MICPMCEEDKPISDFSHCELNNKLTCSECRYSVDGVGNGRFRVFDMTDEAEEYFKE